MTALRFALALIRTPRFFASLLLLPLLLSLVVVSVQVLVTGLFIQTSNRRAAAIEQNFNSIEQDNVMRKVLFGDSKPLPPIKVCRWIASDQYVSGEAPASKDCFPDRFDVAINVSSPADYDPSHYIRIFDGNAERLHLCKKCKPDVVISPEGKVKTHLQSVWGMWIVSLAMLSKDVNDQFVVAKRQYEDLRGRLGVIYFHPVGFDHPIKVSHQQLSVALVFNIAFLIVVALWLALKAHRKVLDYFARSGALQPMVASIGKSSFYSAIWMLTLVRVGAFLLAAVPIMYFSFQDLLRTNKVGISFGDDPANLLLWMLAIGAGFALATIIASIADLKHRHHFLSILYRYVPLLVSGCGIFIWLLTFLFESNTVAVVRNLLSAVPILGLGPVIIAPLCHLSSSVLLMHGLLTITILMITLRSNARWFAAHLEDL